MTNENHSYDDWKAELIRIAARETGHLVTDKWIHDDTAREWYNEGWEPYYTFRECWGNECDA